MYFIMKNVFVLIFANLLLYGLNMHKVESKMQYYMHYVTCVVVSGLIVKAIEILV